MFYDKAVSSHPKSQAMDLYAGLMAADSMSTSQSCPLDTCLRIVQGDLKQDPFPEQSEKDSCSMFGVELLGNLEESGRVWRCLWEQGDPVESARLFLPSVGLRSMFPKQTR